MDETKEAPRLSEAVAEVLVDVTLAIGGVIVELGLELLGPCPDETADNLAKALGRAVGTVFENAELGKYSE